MKKIFILFVLVLGVISVAYAEFVDINEHWAKSEIEWGVEKGIVNGYPDGTFKPDNTITRAEAIKVISTLYNTTSSHKEFNDVTIDDWYYDYVIAGHSVMPELKNNFYPDENITRQDAIYALIKAKYNEIKFVQPHIYNDSYLVSDYASDYISFATKEKLINGYEDNTIKPLSPLTRAEFTKILYNAEHLETPKEEITESKDEEKTISNFIPVFKVETIENENGVFVNKISSDKVTLTTSESFDIPIKQGDTIIPLINHKNLVVDVAILASVNGDTVTFDTTSMNKVNNEKKRLKYYYGEIADIERGKFVTLKNDKEFIIADTEVYFYDTTIRSSKKIYSDYIDIISFEDGKVYYGNNQISKAYIVAREYDGIVTDATIYIF